MGIQHLLKTVKYTDNVIIVSNETLKKMQSLLITMMRDVAKVCDEECISWSLSGGSVLGAVRHQGFIPWDDDIDIFMERSEFENFKNIFSLKLADKYELKCPGDQGHLLTLARIQKKGTKIKTIHSVGDKGEGLFIDIFILENTYDNFIFRYIHGLISTVLLFIDSAVGMDLCKENIFKYTNHDKALKRQVLMRAVFAKLFKIKTLEEWLLTSDKWFSSVKKKGKYLVCPTGGKHFFGEIYKRSMFEDCQKWKFETENWCLPNPPEEYLSLRYGSDYMKIPEEKDRERHVYVELDIGGNI